MRGVCAEQFVQAEQDRAAHAAAPEEAQSAHGAASPAAVVVVVEVLEPQDVAHRGFRYHWLVVAGRLMEQRGAGALQAEFELDRPE